MAGCFQLDTLDTSLPLPPVPPLIDYTKLNPPNDKVVRFDLDSGDDLTLSIPRIFDANGFEHERLHGRWWVDFKPTDTSANFVRVINRLEDCGTTGEDASTDGEVMDCAGCCWEASFTVSSTSFRGEGCYQILVLISDSRFTDEGGNPVVTADPTIPARALWWVWAFSGSSPSPGMDECGEE